MESKKDFVINQYDKDSLTVQNDAGRKYVIIKLA